MMEFILDGIENIVGKVENVGFHHCLLFLLCFQKPLLLTLDCLIKKFIVKPGCDEGDMVVTMALWCMCFHLSRCLSFWFCLHHNFYIYGWILK